MPAVSTFSLWVVLLCTSLNAVQALSVQADLTTPSSGSTGVAAAWASPTKELAANLKSRLNTTTFFDNERTLRGYLRGAVKRKPWAGSYWPAFQDSVNYDWSQTNTSSVAKYAQMFKQDPIELENAVSKISGIDSFPTLKNCTSISMCQSGDECAMRRGMKSGKCVPTWWGSCNGWSAATLFVDQPKCSVTDRGVTMEVNDLKALVTFAFTRNPMTYQIFGLRCNEHKLDVDQYGRPAKLECLDVNPATFHMLLTNYIGKDKKGIIAEVMNGEQVWNHPLESYTMTPYERVPPNAAMYRYFGVNNQTYVFNKNTAEVVRYRTNVTYVTESASTDVNAFSDKEMNRFRFERTYDYILELDSHNKILGGEFIMGSKLNHFDFLWIPTSEPDMTSQAAGISFKNIKSLLKKSANCPRAQA